MSKIVILTFYYFFILASIIGYGFLIKKILKINFENICFGYIGLLGVIFILIYSYFVNFFFGHDKIYNILFLSVGTFYLLLKISKEIFFLSKEIFLSATIFLILYISILIFKTHDDFHYYHFPYTYYLIEQKMVFGTGSFSQGFRTPSSIFYFNANLYLPLGEYYLFNLFPAYIMGFSNLILIKEIFKKQNNYFRYLSLMSFIFINIFFYRLSEHGTDRSALILIFIYLIEQIKLINSTDLNKKILDKLYLLICLIISLKSFYFLYLLFFSPIIISSYNREKKIKNIISFFFYNKMFILALSLGLLVVFSYFANTGCLIYPVNFTCFESVSWALKENDIKSSIQWFELWSKAGANPNFITEVNERANYIAGFSWVGNWLNEYFFTKVSDFLLGVLFLCLVVFIVFKLFNKDARSIKNKINFHNTLLIIIILLFEWFYNHPALRYGGYTIIAFSFFIINAKLLNSSFISEIKFIKISTYLIVLSLLIFFTRNLVRLNKEIITYDYNPINNVYYEIDDRHFRLQKILQDKINSFEFCKNDKKNCSKESSKVKKVFNFYLLVS